MALVFVGKDAREARRLIQIEPARKCRLQCVRGPLHRLTELGHEGIAKCLLTGGANIDAADDKGNTCLILAE